MKKCSVCNSFVDDKDSFCRNCGSNYFIYDNQNNYPQYPNNQNNYSQYTNNQSNLGHPVIWGVLGYFVPLAGIILFFVWKNTNPEQAKGAGIGALINIGLSIIVIIFYLMILFGMMSGSY